MVTTRRMLTKEEFGEIDCCGRFDLVDGELWSQRPMYTHEGRIITDLMFELWQYKADGEVFGSSLGCDLDPAGATILCPDICYFRADRKPGHDADGFYPRAPDLAVELVSDPEPPVRVQMKVALYLEHGTRLVWCLYPDQKGVMTYSNVAPSVILGINDQLDGQDVLPEFGLALSALFVE